MKRLFKLTATMFTTVALGLAGAAIGQEALSRQDKEFIKKAAEMGVAEVEMGKLAEQKASNPALKAHGAKLVADHSKANQELTQLAQKKGVEIKAEPSAAQKREMGSLAKNSGAEFDKEFTEQQVKDHKKAIREFEKAARDAKDPDVKAFAAEHLPHLQNHLAMFQQQSTGAKTTEAAPGRRATSPAGGIEREGRQPAGGRVRTE